MREKLDKIVGKISDLLEKKGLRDCEIKPVIFSGNYDADGKKISPQYGFFIRSINENSIGAAKELLSIFDLYKGLIEPYKDESPQSSNSVQFGFVSGRVEFLEDAANILFPEKRER